MKFHEIAETIDRALNAAGLTAESPRLGAIRTTIDDALAAAGLTSSPARRDPSQAPAARAEASSSGLTVIDTDGHTIEAPRRSGTGAFLEARHTGPQGSLDYKLYVPGGHAHRALPLIVMLHGCTQDPDDFAAGTRMNDLAERHGFLVAYPEQPARANGARCWNWFEPAQQDREGSEPALIAGMVASIAERHAVEPGRVFVAGLSAGAAMAVILGRSHPEIFAGVAAHSGLPAGAAHDVPSAFAAMKGRTSRKAKPVPGRTSVPTLVFHGDADETVAIANGKTIARDAVAAFEREGKALERVLRVDTLRARHRCTTTEFADESGRTVVEEWIVHGGAHAWFGGSPAGSFTDASGPDASAEIVRFFLQP